MRYETRRGIVRLNICGVVFLTPTRKEMNNCSAFLQLNMFNSIIWQFLSENKSIDDVYNLFSRMISNKQHGQEHIKEIIDRNLNEMIEKGYIIRIED